MSDRDNTLRPSTDSNDDFHNSALEQFHDGFPLQLVPDFGIWHLTLRGAAELITVDMWFSGENDFNIEEPENFDGNPHDSHLLSMLADPITLFEQRLIISVDAGHLMTERIGRGFDDKLDPLRTFISYHNLQGWLHVQDYETGDIFDEYGETEMEIAAAISDEVVHLRSISRRGSGEIRRIAFQGWQVKSGKVNETDIEGMLASLKVLIAENERLQAELAKVNIGQPSKVDRPISTRARRTLLTIIGALCKHSGLDPQVRGTAQRVREATEMIGAPVDDDTIRTILKEIPDALESRIK